MQVVQATKVYNATKLYATCNPKEKELKEIYLKMQSVQRPSLMNQSLAKVNFFLLQYQLNVIVFHVVHLTEEEEEEEKSYKVTLASNGFNNSAKKKTIKRKTKVKLICVVKTKH